MNIIMQTVKKIVFIIGFFGSAFLAVIFIILLISEGSKIVRMMNTQEATVEQMQLAELVYQSREAVAGYWRMNEQCPEAEQLLGIRDLPLLKEATVIAQPENSCVIKLSLKDDLENQKLRGKTIQQQITFVQTDDRERFNTECFTDVPDDLTLPRCKRIRDIQALLVK